jgi:hypothetical protein
VALADFVEATTLVAVTITVVLVDTIGAVNRPVAEMVPAVAFQLTARLVALVTVAVNCCVPPEETVADAGATVTETGGGVVWTVTVALPDWDGAETLVAVTVTVVLVDTTGAVNKPVAEMVPALVFHVTA